MALAGCRQGCDAVYGDVVIHAGPSRDAQQQEARIQQVIAALGTPVDQLETTPILQQPKNGDSRCNSPGETDDRGSAKIRRDFYRISDNRTKLCSKDRRFEEGLLLIFNDKANKQSYRDRLLHFCRQNTTFMSTYQIKLLFNNIDAIDEANQALLADLEEALNGHGQWAEILCRHLKKFVPIYQKWYEGYQQAKDVESEASQNERISAFFAQTRKDTANQNIDNIGLRELLMEPVQRIPRYKLFLMGAHKCMSPEDPNIPFVEAGIQIVSEIASCRNDRFATRHATMFGMKEAITHWPSDMSSQGRFFIDSVDVEDMPCAPGAEEYREDGTLLATLLLFNDCLVIVSQTKELVNGRHATGMNDIQALVDRTKVAAFASGSVARSPSKTSPQKVVKLSHRRTLDYKGRIPLNAVSAVDLGHEGFTLWFGQLQGGFGANWSQRPLRRFHVRKTPESGSPHNEKSRFLKHLWDATANFPNAVLEIARIETGAAPAQSYRSLNLSHSGKDGNTATYLTVWTQQAYAKLPVQARRRLAVHLVSGDLSDTTVTSPLNFILGINSKSWRLRLADGPDEAYPSVQQALIRCATIAHSSGVFHVPPKRHGEQSLQPTFIDTRLIESNLSRQSTVRSEASRAETFLSMPSTIGTRSRGYSNAQRSPVMLQNDVFGSEPISFSKKKGRTPLSIFKKSDTQSSLGSARSRDSPAPRDLRLAKSVGHSASMDELPRVPATLSDGDLNRRNRAQSVPPQANEDVEVLASSRKTNDPFYGPRALPPIPNPQRSVSGQKRLRENNDESVGDVKSRDFDETFDSSVQYGSDAEDGSQRCKRSRQDLRDFAQEEERSRAHQRVSAIKSNATKLRSRIDQVQQDRDLLLAKASHSSLRQPLRNHGSNSSLPRSSATINITREITNSENPSKGTDDPFSERLDALAVIADNLKQQLDDVLQDMDQDFVSRSDRTEISHSQDQLRAAQEKIVLLETHLTETSEEMKMALETFEDELENAFDASQKAYPQLSSDLIDELRQSKVANHAANAEISRLRRQLQLQDATIEIYRNRHGALEI